MDVGPNQYGQAAHRRNAKTDVQRPAVRFMNILETTTRDFGSNYKQQGPVRLPVHEGIICDVCGSTIRGVRHKCLDCPDYDMCTPCITYRRDYHMVTHEFFEIEEPGRFIVHAAEVDPPGPVMLPVHEGVTCDVCGSTIRGVRHKCLNCPDYDMCNPCITFRRGYHAMAHEFFEIEEPNRAIFPTVLSNERERETSLASPQVPEPGPVPILHNAMCDMCDSQIYGDRYKCLDCPDYDTCNACFVITPEQHPHNFVKIADPQALIIRRHHTCRCDGCQKEIVGVRYKCAICPDYDLCEECKVNPIPFHPPVHRFLKLSTSAVPLPHHFDRRLQDSTNASAFDRARLEQEVKRAEQAEVDRKRLEQEVEKLQDRLAAAAISPALPPLQRDKVSASDGQSTVRIAVMGATGSGKTSFINLASSSNLRVGTELESCTAEVQLADKFTLDRRVVTFIDTPGFDDTSKSDTEILKMIALFLAATYEEGSTLAGVIYIHRISDNRFSGIAGRNFNLFRKLCGESTLRNVVLVTNMWNQDPQDINEAREKELSGKFFKSTLDKGAQMVRHYNTAQSAHDIVRRIMNNHPVALQIQRELVDEHKDIIDTAAGESINQELKELVRRHQAELKELRGEMRQALRAKDEEMKQELEEVKRDLQERIKETEKAVERMITNYAAEKERTEAKMKEMEQEAKLARERAEAEYNWRLAVHVGRTANFRLQRR